MRPPTQAAVFVALVVASLAAAAVTAIAVQRDDQFDVASVHSEQSSRNYVRLQAQGDTFIAEGATAEMLIRYAYDLKRFQLAGGPDWIRDRDRQFLVRAKFSGDAQVPRLRAMVRRLLADRFQLQARADRQPATVYELTAVPAGVTAARSKYDDPTRRGCLPYPARCTGVSMDDFADYLSDVVIGTLVVNKTGLDGRYDLTVSWSPDSSQFRGNGGVGFFKGDGPSLFTALPEQTGLQLRPVKGDMPIMIVERVTPPSDN